MTSASSSTILTRPSWRAAPRTFAAARGRHPLFNRPGCLSLCSAPFLRLALILTLLVSACLPVSPSGRTGDPQLRLINSTSWCFRFRSVHLVSGLKEDTAEFDFESMVISAPQRESGQGVREGSQEVSFEAFRGRCLRLPCVGLGGHGNNVHDGFLRSLASVKTLQAVLHVLTSLLHVPLVPAVFDGRGGSALTAESTQGPAGYVANVPRCVHEARQRIASPPDVQCQATQPRTSSQRSAPFPSASPRLSISGTSRSVGSLPRCSTVCKVFCLWSLRAHVTWDSRLLTSGS